MPAPDGNGSQGGVPQSGASGGDLAVDPTALKEAAQGLVSAMNELKSVGGAVDGELGFGFEKIELTGMQLGNDGLRSAFAEFGGRWAWGVQLLFDEGNQFAGDLHLAAGAFHDNDEYAKGTFKDLLVDGMGDPDEADQDAEKHSLAWSRGQFTGPDESRAAAEQHMKTTVKASVADEIRSSPGGVLTDQVTGGAASRATADWTPGDTARLMPTEPVRQGVNGK